ncbi:MAG: HAD-IIB family hydrolase [Desulforhopalus sp.]|nr:HAD-IIB family hydrolase [Desulforhopalus sp.]
MRRLLLCTDLDRTLLPNGAAPESAGARELFTQLANRDDVVVAFVTGRHLALVKKAIADYSLPLPEIIVADVGTTIYRSNRAGWRRMKSWDHLLDADWRGLSWRDIDRLVGNIAGLSRQEEAKQGKYKLSFCLSLTIDPQPVLCWLETRLRAAQINAALVWSIDEEKETGLIDLIPQCAGKLPAIRFVMHQYGFSLKGVLFAGDSGNDLDVLQSDIPSVLVANAHPVVKQQVTSSTVASLHIASGGYLGMNGNYAAGILEGAAYFWPAIDAWLQRVYTEQGS